MASGPVPSNDVVYYFNHCSSEDAPPLNRRGSSSSRISIPAVVIPSCHLDSTLHSKAAEITKKRHSEEQASADDGNHDDDLMTPPELLLKRSLKLAERLEMGVVRLREEGVADILDCWIHNIALARIVYGNSHWILAKMHVRLGRAYLKFKALPQQALLHAIKGCNILVAPGSHVMSHDPPFEAMCQLASAHCVVGQVYTIQGHLPKAEGELVKGNKIFSRALELPYNSDTDIELETDFLTAFAWLYLKQGRFDSSREHFSRSINLTKTAFGPDTSRLLPLLRGRATTEAHLSMYEAAAESLQNAVQISETNHGVESEEIAEIIQAQGKLGAVKLRGGITVDINSVEDKFLRAISIFSTLSDPKHKKALSCKEELCLVLAFHPESQERAITLIKELLAAKKEMYGELDMEVGHSLKLLATVLLARGRADTASIYLQQARNVYANSLGANHKETLALSSSLETISGSTDDVKQSSKPIFKTVF